MRFHFRESLLALSYALDCVEHDLIGVTTNHGKRVAALAITLGKRYLEQKGEDTDGQENRGEILQALASCAILHDCALTEYIQEEYCGELKRAIESHSYSVGMHCTMGERHLMGIPYKREYMDGAILYHHENADGTGPFEKKEDEIPLFAKWIHLADHLDSEFDLSWVSREKYEKITSYVREKEGILFGSMETELFLEQFSFDQIKRLSDEKIDLFLEELLPEGKMECTPEQLMRFADVFAAVVDYKSHFTKSHSRGIAKKAKRMAEYYGADKETAAKLYFAGALHDIGKLTVDRDVLEKPDKLTDEEYKHIQSHAYGTYRILRKIEGVEDITCWASRHHEKLDGTGYPFHLKAEQLDQWDRLLANLDIYQALTEERPYKKGMSHENTMGILRKMSQDGKLDMQITEDIDQVMAVKEI